ncbi:MFS transporter [Sabulicella glaciei]|uniref:MFS transporter n=1 Tax=Sabulicella glaciei TaxID=2984948 RepID=A0ABT3NTP9_9PROT|nr:MFS transporter [Roseococcus sp. MDT2-1-1]MCW8085542.1 MFS transporter [Roseococcus sp. MDT2-1-1]
MSAEGRQPAQTPICGQAGGGTPLLSLVAVIGAATIFGLTYSLTAPLVALNLAERGLGETWIGLNAAMHAVGVLMVAPLLPRLAGRFGVRPLLLVALLSTAALLLLFPAIPIVWMWFVLRIGLGAGAEILFVLTESWANELSSDRTRGRVMATYTAMLSLGFAGGPLILSVTGTDGILPFAVGSGAALLALLLLVHPGVTRPAMQAHGQSNLLRFMRLAPVAMSTTALNAAVETAGLSFMVIYAARLGWEEQAGTQLITTLMVGAILLQLPIGWLCDKMDRRTLMLWLGGLCTLGALAWPILLQTPWVAYPALFLWGGLFVGIYTTMLAIVGSRFRGTDLVGVYAAMGLLWGGGALVGPSLTGAALDMARHGLPLFVALACGSFTLALLLSPALSRRRTAPA